MRRFFTVILLSVAFYSCKPGIPKDIIQPPEMEKILYDIHLVDGYASTMVLPIDSTKKVISPFYKGVYKKYGVDSLLYNRSLNYYYKHPQLLKEMYERLTPKLMKARDKALALPVPAPVSNNSPVKQDTVKARPETLPNVNEAKPVQ